MAWSSSGRLANAGVLVHVFDGWEDHGSPWLPATNGPGAHEQSASLIFAAQHIAGLPLALFGGGGGGGIVFKPLATKVNCGKAQDSAGKCGSERCPSTASVAQRTTWQGEPAGMCRGPWRPEDFGAYLRVITAEQQQSQRSQYNEIIVDAPYWRDNDVDVIEFIYGRRDFYDRFLAANRARVDTREFPFLTIDIQDWHSPFRLGGAGAGVGTGFG